MKNIKKTVVLAGVAVTLASCGRTMMSEHTSVGGGWLYENRPETNSVVISGQRAVSEYLSTQRHSVNAVNDANIITKADFDKSNHVAVVDKTLNNRPQTKEWKMQSFQDAMDTQKNVLEKVRERLAEFAKKLRGDTGQQPQQAGEQALPPQVQGYRLEEMK